MACCLFIAKPLPESILNVASATNCSEIWIKTQFPYKMMVWIWRLQNGSRLVCAYHMLTPPKLETEYPSFVDNIMLADALAHKVARASTGMVLAE